MKFKILLISIGMILFYERVDGLTLVEPLRHSCPQILNNRLSGAGVWDADSRQRIFWSPYGTYLTANSFFCSDGTNTFLYRSNDGSFIAQIPDNNYSYNPFSSYLWSFPAGVFRAYSETGSAIACCSLGVIGSFYPYPNEIRYSTGSPSNAIYKYSFSDSSLQNIGNYAGDFSCWFLDGGYFLTRQGTMARLYNKNAQLIKLVDMPTTNNLGGSGIYFWAWENPDTLFLYRTNSSVVEKYPVSGVSSNSVRVFPTYRCIGLLPYGPSTFSIIELNDTIPKVSTHIGSRPYLLYFNADTACNWTTANNNGVTNYGKLSGQPVTLNFGQIRDIAGTTNGKCAIAASSGLVVIFSFRDSLIEKTDTFDLWTGKVCLSGDGKYLAGAGSYNWDGQYLMSTDLYALSLYDAESRQLVKQFPHSTNILINFDLSRDGSMIGQQTKFDWTYSNYIYVIPTSDSIFLNADFTINGPQISPTNEYVATTSRHTTKLYKSGVLNNALSGQCVGWLNDSQFVNTDDTSICSVSGVVGPSSHFPIAIDHFQAISDSEIYVNDSMVIDVRTGNVLYVMHISGNPSSVVGYDYIVYVDNNCLKITNWRAASNAYVSRPRGISGRSVAQVHNASNPFASSTCIQYSIPNGLRGTIEILSCGGRSLFSHPISGEGTLIWEASGYSNGLYLCRLRYSTSVLQCKLLLVK